MCTVSYIPIEGGYILTSNRDENPLRETLSPQKQHLSNGETLLAPVDSEKRGTWIATNMQNKTACLLNGAFQKHERTLPYRRSRGQYVVEAFTHVTFSAFAKRVDLHQIEPFTLIFIEDGALQVLVWDGKDKHYSLLNAHTPWLWSSATLYTPEQHQVKERFFTTAIQDTVKITPQHILNIHGLHEETPFILNRLAVKTVSIAQVVSKDKNITLNYYPKTEVYA